MIFDCLSRVLISDIVLVIEFEDVIGINLIENFGFESGILKRFKEILSNDEILRVVMEYVLKGWLFEKE